MPGNRKGGLKTAIINKRQYGEDFYRRIGKIGGSMSNTGGFGSSKIGADGLTGKERAARAGSVGGSRRRGYKKRVTWQ